MITVLTEEEFQKVKSAFVRLNSMVVDNKLHTKESKKVTNDALNILTFKDIFSYNLDSKG